MDGPTAPLRSRTESFPYYALGGGLYLAGALLVLYGPAGPVAEALEAGLLLGGSAVVLLAFLIDRGSVPPIRRRSG